MGQDEINISSVICYNEWHLTAFNILYNDNNPLLNLYSNLESIDVLLM